MVIRVPTPETWTTLCWLIAVAPAMAGVQAQRRRRNDAFRIFDGYRKPR